MSAQYERWWVIAWRLLWIVPAQILRCLLVVVTLIGWGKRMALDIWEYTG